MSLIYRTTTKQFSMPLVDRWIMQKLADKISKGNTSEMIRTLTVERAALEGITAESVLTEQGMPLSLLQKEINNKQPSAEDVIQPELIEVKQGRGRKKKEK